jgi:hypothetical protein
MSDAIFISLAILVTNLMWALQYYALETRSRQDIEYLQKRIVKLHHEFFLDTEGKS